MLKKIAIGIVVSVLLVAAAFFAIGFIWPTFTVETRVTINKPRDVVWKYFTDSSRQKEWMTNLASIEPLEGPPLTKGSKFRLTFEEDGSRIVMTETMTEVVENEVFAFVLENDVIHAEDRIVLIDRGDKTEIVETDVITGGNPMWRSLFIIMKPTFQTKSAAIYSRLKTNVEKLP